MKRIPNLRARRLSGLVLVGAMGLTGSVAMACGDDSEAAKDPGERTIYFQATEQDARRAIAQTAFPQETRDGFASERSGSFVFLSQRGLFTIDLYVADVRTGQILGRLTSSIRNAHYDALSFLNSAGGWSPDGSRFAFVTFADGDNEVAIAEIESRDIVRTIDLGDVTAVHDVAWSPDGRRLVVSGMKGGITDLFMVDLENGRVEQVTNDRFTELTPAWSPDGATIAFATDHASDAELERLDLPTMGLGFLDPATGETRVERPFAGAKHINPQFSPDGGSVYFISDRGGFSDIYRLDRASGELFQVTRVTTGISGITEFAPALSV